MNQLTFLLLLAMFMPQQGTFSSDVIQSYAPSDVKAQSRPPEAVTVELLTPEEAKEYDAAKAEYDAARERYAAAQRSIESAHGGSYRTWDCPKTFVEIRGHYAIVTKNVYSVCENTAVWSSQ